MLVLMSRTWKGKSAFIAEPAMGNGGWISPLPEYWPTVRKICTDYKALLIADEVITGFRQNRQDVCSSTLDCQRAMLKISERRVTENEKRFKNNGNLRKRLIESEIRHYPSAG